MPFFTNGMYAKYHTKGIVLGGRNDSDDSRRVSIFTEEFGLINAKVQGARNIQSKLRFGSQYLSVGEFSLIHGKAGWKVVSARTEKNIFEILRHDPDKLAVSVNILNLVRKLAGEEALATELFSIVENFLDFIVQAEKENVSLAECLALLRILHSLGYMRHDPEFSIPISSPEIQSEHLALLAPRRLKMIELINESLKATNLT